MGYVCSTCTQNWQDRRMMMRWYLEMWGLSQLICWPEAQSLSHSFFCSTLIPDGLWAESFTPWCAGAISAWSDLCDLQQFSRHQLCQQAVERTALLVFKTAQCCVKQQNKPGVTKQHIQVGMYKSVVQFLGSGNYRYEDNFPTAQSAGWHSLLKCRVQY